MTTVKGLQAGRRLEYQSNHPTLGWISARVVDVDPVLNTGEIETDVEVFGSRRRTVPVSRLRAAAPVDAPLQPRHPWKSRPPVEEALEPSNPHPAPAVPTPRADPAPSGEEAKPAQPAPTATGALTRPCKHCAQPVAVPDLTARGIGAAMVKHRVSCPSAPPRKSAAKPAPAAPRRDQDAGSVTLEGVRTGESPTRLDLLLVLEAKLPAFNPDWSPAALDAWADVMIALAGVVTPPEGD